MLRNESPRPPAPQALYLEEKCELIDTQEHGSPPAARLFFNAPAIYFKMSWPDIWGRATREQLHTFNAVHERQQKRSQLAHVKLHVVNIPMLLEVVKSREELVDVWVPATGRYLPENTTAAFSLLNSAMFLVCSVHNVNLWTLV